MATPTRELSITYGSITVGGVNSGTYQLDGWTRHIVVDGKADSSVEFECLVVASTAAGLAALCRSVERAFRTPRQSLTIAQEGQVLLMAHHADAEGGFNTEPKIRKIGDVGDSGRSRRYTLSVAFETPADTASTSGLRESRISVSYDPARIRTITIAGTFTAVPQTPSARARYEAAIGAHVTSALSGLSVTNSELIGEPIAEHDYDDKVLRFERTYLENIFGQGQDAANDDADIVAQTLSVMRREFSEERSPATAIIQGGGGISGSAAGLVAPGTVQALASFDLHYECSIDSTSSTALKAKYDSLRSWLLSQFSGVFSQGTFALTVEKVETDRVNNRIVVDMTAEGSVKGATILRRTVSSEKRETPGLVFRGKWTGDPLDYYVYRGHDIVLRITTASARHLTTLDPTTIEQQNEEFAESFGGAGVSGGQGFTIEKSSTITPLRIGIEGSGHVLNLLDVTSTVTRRVVNATGGGSGPAIAPRQIIGGGQFSVPLSTPVSG